MNRRAFLTRGALGLGAVGVPATAVALKSGGGVARAQGPPMRVLERFTRRGRAVEIHEHHPGHEVMSLDGRVLSHHVFARMGARRYASHMLPFEEFRSARALATALVDGDAAGLFIL